MNRAFHIAAVVWAAFSLLILGLGCSAAWGCLFGAAAFLLLLLFGKKRLPLWVYSAAAAVFLCSFSLLLRQDGMQQRAAFAGTEQKVRGVVTDQVFYEDTCRMSLRLDASNPVGLRGASVLLYSKPGVDVWPGDVVEYALQLKASSAVQAGSKDVDFQAFGTSPRILGKSETWEVCLARLRRTMASRFAAFLSPGQAAMVSGVLFGCTERLSDALRLDFAKAGISHFLAVSGMHLNIVLSMVVVLLQRCWLSRRQRILLEMALAAGIVLLTGLAPSILRAAGMYLLYRCAFLFGRDADGLNSLGMAVIAILIVNPYGVFSISLQLSYLSTMGICAFTEPIYNGLVRLLCRQDGASFYESAPVRATLLSLLAVSLAAQCLTMPLTCWYFGRVSVIGPLVNLLITVPGSLLLFFGVLAALLGFFPALISPFYLFSMLSGLCADVIALLAGWAAGVPGASFPVQDGVLIAWMTLLLVVLIVLWYHGLFRSHALWAASWGAGAWAALCCLRLLLWGYPVTVAVPDYGRSMLVFYGQQSVLVGAPKDSGEAEKLMHILEDYRVHQLDLVISAKEEDMDAYGVRLLTKAYPPEQLLHMDTYESFDAKLFAGIALSKQSETAVALEWGGFTLVKEFGKEPPQAHCVVNRRNEVTMASGVQPIENSRYYQSTRYFFPAGMAAKEMENEVPD